MSDECEIICQEWEESERDWGVRPDGFTLHVDGDAAERFRRAYFKRMRDVEAKEGYGEGHAPDCYTRNSGSPYKVKVSKELFESVKESGDGMWGKGNRPDWDATPRERK